MLSIHEGEIQARQMDIESAGTIEREPRERLEEIVRSAISA